MKKLGKFIVIVVLLPLLYLFISAIVGGMFMAGYSVANEISLKSIDPSKLQSLITPYIYIITLMGDIVMLLLLILFFLPTKESLLKRCNFKKCSLKKVIYISLFVMGFAMLNSIFVGLVSDYFSSYRMVSNALSAANTSIIQTIVIVIIIPIFEEMFFRGVIFSWLKKNFNIVFAIIVQALIFGIMHGNILQGVYAFVSGIIFALINIYTDSLYGNIVAHCLFNLFESVIVPLFLSRINIVVYSVIAIVLCFIGIVKVVSLKKMDSINIGKSI
ncbi:CPBP family intramembrane glutamic endopeptidase [Inconstantimicrobium mannanitabidum]|uniref:Uncharacterized protein n=1 Tax=Inconstantimicrobium mannanitabidum TaxID=1604901 RepID=A0ACB5RGU0_9CLOT|nr:type II CAAX endopeptidase family protein [Clostridium sp. TW13]GKX68286.1 hypothetical protein rsdtw13_35440 [Clostridium sp. TW13]